MLAVIAMIVFVIAALLGFTGIWSTVGVVAMASVGLACLAGHFAFGFSAVTWRRVQ